MISLAQICTWATTLRTVFIDNREYLTELDSAIGDADHGINMARGFTAVATALEDDVPGDIGAALKIISMTLIKNVGGASGPLYGTFFLKASLPCMGRDAIGVDDLVLLVREGVKGIRQRGKAVPGDKTMVDAWEPALAAMTDARSRGGDIEAVLIAAARAAAEGRDATIPMLARKGRASYLGERSRGHQDPGATSTALILATARDTLV